MANIVKAKCRNRVYDSVKCILYYPGDIEENLDLDSDVALSFELKPTDWEYARKSAVERSKARTKELTEMKNQGFSNLFEFRNYKRMAAEVEEEKKQQAAV